MKAFLQRVQSKPLVVLVAILSFAFITRITLLYHPEAYVFDEVYHSVTAKLMAQNNPSAYEWWHEAPEPRTAIDWLHPPFAKLTQAFFIWIFGYSSFSWRLSSVLFGVGVIGLTYLVGSSLFKSHKVGLMAASLAAVETLLLTQSRIAMNDIHVTFFVLLTVWCYWQWIKHQRKKWSWMVATAISAGLAIATKWSGFFVIVAVGLFEYLAVMRLLLVEREKILRTLIKLLKAGIIMALIPLGVYFASYSQMWLQTRTNGTDNWTHFTELHHQIWLYQTNLDATHEFQSRPWDWFINAVPVWYWAGKSPSGTSADVWLTGNTVLFWVGDVVALTAVFGVLLATLKLKKMAKVAQFISLYRQDLTAWFLVLLVYGLLWIPWQLSPRIMFFYHYTPAVPFLMIILGATLAKLRYSSIFFGVTWVLALVFMLSKLTVIYGL